MSMDGKDHEHHAAGDSPPEQKSKVSPRTIAIIVVVAFSLLFVVQNTSKTRIHLLFLELRAGTWFAILVAIVLGVLLDRAFIWWWSRRKAPN